MYILILAILLSCAEKPKEAKLDSVKPFSFSICDYDYSMAYAIRYILTENELMIVLLDEVEQDSLEATQKSEKTNILFDSLLLPSETLRKLSEININKLEKRYNNPCIMDGTQIMVNLTKDGKTKDVQLSNYYQPDIGLAIELVNSLTPKKYKIYYDKDALLKKMAECK